MRPCLTPGMLARNKRVRGQGDLCSLVEHKELMSKHEGLGRETLIRLLKQRDLGVS
ncbi:hypothetical protein SAMN05661010_01118 [Modicisalibacter muralis]|uniref:Uncharacterized protein n=1 Tax=Modicisalibacter muralis TaxID=119000 RepID=A0A1G9IB86_9GAMM|nr:hypothetical protein SAMN05661010_01118 [Halomonas muralis]